MMREPCRFHEIASRPSCHPHVWAVPCVQAWTSLNFSLELNEWPAAKARTASSAPVTALNEWPAANVRTVSPAPVTALNGWPAGKVRTASLCCEPARTALTCLDSELPAVLAFAPMCRMAWPVSPELESVPLSFRACDSKWAVWPAYGSSPLPVPACGVACRAHWKDGAGGFHSPWSFRTAGSHRSKAARPSSARGRCPGGPEHFRKPAHPF